MPVEKPEYVSVKFCRVTDRTARTRDGLLSLHADWSVEFGERSRAHMRVRFFPRREHFVPWLALAYRTPKIVCVQGNAGNML